MTSLPRTVFKGAGNKTGSLPDPARANDRHSQLGGLLLKAELAPEPLERLLAVCRLVLALSTDLLRPGAGFGDVPVALLGQHHLSRRQLADRHKGDPCQLFLQEVCSHEPLAPTHHAKYDAPGSRQLATLALRAAPAAAVAPPRAAAKGVVEMLVGGGSASSTDEPYLEVGFEGGGTLALPRHGETFTFSLPSLLLLQPLADACPLELGGEARVACAASGLSATLRFGRGRRVRGSVSRAGGGEVAAIDGSWEGAVGVESLEQEAAGTLFDASQLAPPLALAISLADPGPRACARLWSAVLEAATALDAGAAARAGGRRGSELVAALPRHMRRALLYEVESAGRPAKKQQQQPAAEAEGAGATSDAKAALPLPPCVLDHRAKHGGPVYQLSYWLQAVEMVV